MKTAKEIETDLVKAQTIVAAVLEEFETTYTRLAPTPWYLRNKVWQLMSRNDERRWYWGLGDRAWDDIIATTIMQWHERRGGHG